MLSLFGGDKHELCLVIRFTVAQALTSLMHYCIECSCSYILSEGADICNGKSSANEWCDRV